MTLPTPPRDDGEEDVKKSKGPITLDAKQHSFEFEFVIPNNLELPSFMEVGVGTAECKGASQNGVVLIRMCHLDKDGRQEVL
ncbi:hypothetical protein BC936DRAFT_143941 [Jimgerdemannia flammicorona]|uniref:Uncharacterized protein n=1 Tax=Jimgerdemannia flammicorona TaxID=994334 RepID=A0A432ZYC0_9FUNG|nr:hypothetical protein BC936DRAFT_143941 [Jimgerdemannia flammicorona]